MCAWMLSESEGREREAGCEIVVHCFLYFPNMAEFPLWLQEPSIIPDRDGRFDCLIHLVFSRNHLVTWSNQNFLHNTVATMIYLELCIGAINLLFNPINCWLYCCHAWIHSLAFVFLLLLLKHCCHFIFILMTSIWCLFF